MWNLWVFDVTWRVLASYDNATDGRRPRDLARADGQPAELLVDGGAADSRVRLNVTGRDAPCGED